MTCYLWHSIDLGCVRGRRKVRAAHVFPLKDYGVYSSPLKTDPCVFNNIKLVITYPTPSRKVKFMSIPRLLACDAGNRCFAITLSHGETVGDRSVQGDSGGSKSVTPNDQSIVNGIRQYSDIEDG